MKLSCSFSFAFFLFPVCGPLTAKLHQASRSSSRKNIWPLVIASQQLLNVDASFIEGFHLGSYGEIVRDHRGQFIAGSTSQLEHVTNVVSAEAAAVHEGLKLLQSLGCNNVQVRMDNIIVVEALRLNEGYSMVTAPLLDDCRELIREFRKVTIEHCNRESNVVAHELAKWGRVNNPSIWIDAPRVLLLHF
ncbi:hypothetical protein ZWY2020_023133 [Hordeum vulgare]|nr:hypothetical protein ZWY2020_023133 [Hordeum vulgare]